MLSIRSHVSDYSHEKEKKEKSQPTVVHHAKSTSPSNTWQRNVHHYCLREARYLMNHIFDIQWSLHCQKDGEQQLQQGQMMAHSPGYPTDNNRQPDGEGRSREKQRGSRRGS